MNLGEKVAEALPTLRVQAESLMRSRCTIERENGTTWNGTKTVAVWEVVHEDIPCRVSLSPVGSRSLLTDELVTAETPVVKIGVGHTGVKPDDRVTIDGDVDNVLWVTQAPVYTDMVQIRLQCRRSR